MSKTKLIKAIDTPKCSYREMLKLQSNSKMDHIALLNTMLSENIDCFRKCSQCKPLEENIKILTMVISVQ